jgi:GNAT superfamily N-acetyltransferase
MQRRATSVLRRAGTADADRLIELAQTFHQEDGHPLSAAGEHALLDLLKDDSPEGRAYLIVQGGATVGYAVLGFGYSVEYGGRDAFVDDLFLLREARGQGIGRQVVRALEDEARICGVNALHVEVMRGNAAGCFYGRLGFRDRGSRLMTKRLAAGEILS